MIDRCARQHGRLQIKRKLNIGQLSYFPSIYLPIYMIHAKKVPYIPTAFTQSLRKKLMTWEIALMSSHNVSEETPAYFDARRSQFFSHIYSQRSSLQ